MEFKEVVFRRQSIRRFKPEPVPREEILDMLRTATQAANASNKQVWRFIVITNDEVKQRMREAVSQELRRLYELAGRRPPESDFSSTLFSGAPVTIAVAYDKYESAVEPVMRAAGMSEREIVDRRQRPDIQSIGACIQLLLCAAYEKGYGTCWMTAPMVARPQLETILGIEPPLTLCALVALGRPAEAPNKTSRRPVEDLVRFIE